MPRKVVVPQPISQAIGLLGISRPLCVRLLTALHNDLSNVADEARNLRDPEDETLFLYPIRLTEESRHHLFVLAVDDTTAPDHLVLASIGHVVEDRF